MNLNQITLPVKNIEEAVFFYLKLGFIQIVDSEYYARFKCPEGDASFSLMLDMKNYSNGSVIYFENEKLDEWVANLISMGIVFDQLPRNETYLWREAILRDPSGNKIKLYWAGANRLMPPWVINKKIGD